MSMPFHTIGSTLQPPFSTGARLRRGDLDRDAMFDLEPVVHDLRACVTLMGAMITQLGHDKGSLHEEQDYAWRKLETDMLDLTRQVVDMWDLAFEQWRDEIAR